MNQQFSIQEIAKILQVKRPTVLRWVREGRIKPTSYTLDREPLFDIDTLDNILSIPRTYEGNR